MYEIYAKLRDLRGLSDYRVAKDTGLGRSTFSDWKGGKHRPSLETITKLAEYFGVSVAYLTTGKDTEKTSNAGNTYYFSDETAETAQELFENKDLRLLFDAAKDARPENLRIAADLLKRLKETNPDG